MFGVCYMCYCIYVYNFVYMCWWFDGDLWLIEEGKKNEIFNLSVIFGKFE